jgi:tetratricopeptide (TPR) repeat protein
MKKCLAAGLALTIATVGGAADRPAPAPSPAPYAGVYQPQGKDEIGLWREDDENERAMANSPQVIRDEALTGYVKGVLCSVVGADRCNATRVYVVREPSFNATMSPNGTMRVYSGLLLRVRSEAELGSVLGHEFGHFEQRHSLAAHKAWRSSSNFMAWAAVLASFSTYAAQTFNSTQLSIYGGFYRFGRNQEREADLLGLGYLNASTHRPQAAARVWRNQIAEVEASAKSRGLSKPRFDRIAFYASHPPTAERAGYLAALARTDADGRDEGKARYAAAMARWTPVFLNDQIKLNDFGASEYILASLAEDGWTAPLLFARGELFRGRGMQRDLVHAAEFYAKAVEMDPNLAEAHRGLGLALAKIGRGSESRAAIQSYLRLKPDAPDASVMAMTLTSLGAN